MKILDMKTQLWATLGILGVIVFFSIAYPLMRLTPNKEQMKLEEIQTKLNSLKSSTMPDAALQLEITKTQAAFFAQKEKADAEINSTAPRGGLDLTEIIVLSALVLALIWIILHEVKIVAYFFTIILFSVGIYTHLRNNLGIDLLDGETQLKIFILIVGSLVSGFGCIFLFAVFNRALHKKNMHTVMESMPMYAHEYARHEAYIGEGVSKAIAYSAFNMMSENGSRKLNSFSNDDILPREKTVEYAQTRPANNQQPANKVGGV